MDNQTEEVILNIIVKNDDALKRIKENKEDIAELREAQSLLNKKTEEGKQKWQEYENEITNLRKENSLWTKEIRDNNRSMQEQEGSIKSMRAELSQLNKVYVNLSETERNSAKGRELQEKILSLNTTIGDAEKQLGDFRRQVGNYENSITSALGANNKFISTLIMMKDGGMNLSSAFKTVTTSVVNFGRALYAAILANPIVAVIAGIIAALTGLVKIMRGNEEQSARLDAVLAPLKRTFEGIISVLQIVAGFVLDVAEGFQALSLQATKLGESIPFIGKYFKQSNDAMLSSIQLSKDKAELDKRERVLNVENAKAQYESSELRKKAEDKVKYSAEERLKFVQEANKKEQDILDNQIDIAEEKLRIAKEEATWSENSKEANEKIAEYEANLYILRKNNADKTKELVTKENEIMNQTIADDKKRVEELKKIEQQKIEQKKKEIELVRQAEDAAFALIKEGAEKQRIAINTAYDRKIEDLKKQLSTEKKLTEEGRNAINKTIISLEEQREKEIKELNDQALQDKIKRETERVQLQLDAVKEGTQKEHELRLALIEQNRQAELASNRKLAEDLRQAEEDINAAYRKQVSDEDIAWRQEQYQKATEMFRLEWENKLLQAREGSLEEGNIKIQQAQAEHDALINIDAQTKSALYQSEEAYTNAVLQSKNKIKEAIKNQIDTENEAVLMQMQAASTITDAFSSMIDAFAEDNERLAGFAKSLALFNIGVSSATAIANGIATATTAKPWFMIPVAIATTIATVMTNIAKAKQLLSKEKQPKYSYGGDIIGPSHANGGVSIEAEGGEAIINKKSMSNPLLRSIASAVNVAGGGVPFANVPNLTNISGGMFNSEGLKEAFAEALKEMPKPIVSVQEINRVQQNVRVIENNSQY